MSKPSTTPDPLYTYADDDDLFVADSATVLELLAAFGRPYVGRARDKTGRGWMRGMVADALDQIPDRPKYVGRHRPEPVAS